MPEETNKRGVETKPVVPETTKETPTATVPATQTTAGTATTTTTKKSSNTLILIVIILVVIIGICCGVPFLLLRVFGIALQNGNFNEGFKNAVENRIEEEAKKNGKDIDINLSGDTKSTKPLPSQIPAKIRSLIPSSWGNPYSTVHSTEETTGNFYAIYTIENKDKKDIDTVAEEIETNIAAGGWKSSKTTLSTGAVSFSISSKTDEYTSLTITLSETGNTELGIIFGGTYLK